MSYQIWLNIDTPRNGSWLNVAEIELSILSKQCLDRRIPTTEELHKELEAWNQERNQTAIVILNKTGTNVSLSRKSFSPKSVSSLFEMTIVK